MTTTVVYSDTSDGFIYNEDEVSYANARAGGGTWSSLFEYTSGSDLLAGQYFGDPFSGGSNVYGVNETFLAFDTHDVGTDTVSAAVLRVTSNADASDTDFTIQARLHDWGATLTTADWVAGADLSGLTLLAHYATSSGFTSGTGYDLVDDALPANVNKTGSTRLLLCSSRTTNSNEPTGNEYVWIRAADYAGTTSDPKLTVTHAAGGSTLFLMLEDDSGAYELEDDSGGILLEPGA